jgi:hypothetical protein
MQGFIVGTPAAEGAASCESTIDVDPAGERANTVSREAGWPRDVSPPVPYR